MLGLKALILMDMISLKIVMDMLRVVKLMVGAILKILMDIHTVIRVMEKVRVVIPMDTMIKRIEMAMEMLMEPMI
jgi:hypothetical protein